MNTITADAAVEAVFGGLAEPVELRDSDGRLMGVFTPASRDEADVYSRAAAHFNPDEKQRRKDSGRVGLTTDDVLARIAGTDQS